MNVLIVFAHPSHESYTFRILEQLHDQLRKQGHAVEISDLYQSGFGSDMTEHEYRREGFGRADLPVPKDVQEEHKKIEAADSIIFLYPLWWSDCPAKLKGWFDRVYSVGYAYGYDENGKSIRKMKTLRYGHVICTAGHPNRLLAETGIEDSMRTIMLHDRLGARFQVKEMTILGGTLELENVREHHQAKIRGIVKSMT